MNLSLLLLFILLTLFSCTFSATCNWIGTNGPFNTAANWNSCNGGAPTINDDVIFTKSASFIAESVSIKSLTIQVGTLTFGTATRVNCTSLITFDGTLLSNNGNFYIVNSVSDSLLGGDGIVQNSGTLHISRPTTSTKTWKSLTNTGTVTIERISANINFGSLQNDAKISYSSNSARTLTFDVLNSASNASEFYFTSPQTLSIVATSISTAGIFDVSNSLTSIVNVATQDVTIDGHFRATQLNLFGNTLLGPNANISTNFIDSITLESRTRGVGIVIQYNTSIIRPLTGNSLQIKADLKFTIPITCLLHTRLEFPTLVFISFVGAKIIINQESSTPVTACGKRTLDLITGSSLTSSGSTLSLATTTSSLYYLSITSTKVQITLASNIVSTLTWLAGWLIGMMLINCCFALTVCVLFMGGSLCCTYSIASREGR